MLDDRRRNPGIIVNICISRHAGVGRYPATLKKLDCCIVYKKGGIYLVFIQNCTGIVTEELKMHMWMITGSWIFGTLGVLSIAPVIMSPIMFDSSTYKENLATHIFFYSLTSFPVVVLITELLSWYVYANHSELYGLVFMYIPVINIMLGITVMAYSIVFQSRRIRK